MMDDLVVRAYAPPAAAPAWFASAHDDFAQRLLDPEQAFPCHFDVQGQVAGQNWFSAVDRDDSEWRVDTLARTLSVYRGRIRKLTHCFVVERFVLFGEDLGRDDRSCLDSPAR